MAASSLADSSAAAVVLMLGVGLLMGAWAVAVITNFRGYRDSHARRSIAAGRRFSPWGRSSGAPAGDERAFARAMQYIVAGVFLVVAAALAGTASLELVRRMTGG